MSCLIDRNNEGKIIKVRTPQGEESQLFKAIHSNVFLGDAESSVNILSAAYSPEVGEVFSQGGNTYSTGEPRLFLTSSKGNEFESLEEMIIADELGTSTIGFKNPTTNQFIPIAKFDTTTSEKNQFLTDQIQHGILSAERVLQSDGVTRFQGKGSFSEVRKVMAQAAKFEAVASLGNGRTKVNNDGTFEIEFVKDTTIAEYKDDQKIVEVKDIPSIIEDPSLQNRVDLLIQYEALKDSTEPFVESAEVKPLLDSLYSFLNSMGFTNTTLEEYRKNYNTKYGKDPDILAISDMANKVVAIARGADVSAELTEEVAHIAIEAFAEQNSIAAALATVHLTPEYKEHAPYYTEKYAPFHSGIELEDKVRKEILGKVLARQIRDKFNTENKSAIETTLVQKLQDIFTRFVEYIRSIFKPQHLQALTKITDKIAENIIKGDIALFDKAFESDNFYYSAMSSESRKIEDDLQAIKSTLGDMFSRVLKQSTPRQAELDRIMDDMSDTEILSSINTITGITKTQLDVLKLNVDKANKEGKRVEAVDVLRYAALRDSVLPILNNISVSLQDRVESSDEKFSTKNLKIAIDTLDMITKVRDIKNNVEPLINTHHKQNARRLIKDALANTSLTEEQKEQAVKEYESVLKDTTWLGRTFGIVSQSRNPYIQLLYRAIVKMNTIVNNKFKTEADKAVNEIYTKGLQKFERDIIKRINGKATYYNIGFINWTAYYEAQDELKIRLISEITGKSEEAVKKLYTKNSAEEIIGDAKKVLEFREKFREDGKELNENRFNELYDIERERIFEKAGIVKESPTRTIIANKNGAAYARNRKYANKDGIIDKTLQTEADKLQDAADYQAYLSVKSAFDQFGNLREGLQRVKVEELTDAQKESLPVQGDFLKEFKGEITVLRGGITKEELDEDALVALELSNMDVVYLSEREETGKKNPSDLFIDQVIEQEINNGNAFDFVSANSTFSISSEYYENLGQSTGFNDVAQKYINSLIAGERVIKQPVFDELKELQRARKDLLKQAKKIKTPTETDVINMTGVIQNKILELDEAISQKRKDLKIPTEYYEQMSFNKKGLRELSEDFDKMLIDSGLSVRDFCEKHMSTSNKTKLYDFIRDIDDFAKKRKDVVKAKHVDFVNSVRNGYTEAEWNEFSSQEKIDLFTELFAKEHVASYFQKNTPEGFTEAYEAIKSGTLKLSEVLKNKESFYGEYPGLRYLDINPDYAWTQNISNNEFTNPRHKTNQYKIQPNIDKFFDPEFTNTFGITKEEFIEKGDDLNLYTPSKNKEQFELLKILTNLRLSANENLGGKNDYNKFQRVQISRTSAERVMRSINSSTGENVKNLFADMFQNRIDEKEYGETIMSDLNVDVKLIPKYFQSKLENVEEISENSIQSELLNLKESIKYTEKTKIEDDVNSLMFALTEQKFKSNGGSLNKQKIRKKGEVSNFYQQAKEYTDFHLYGVKQSRHMETEILGRTFDLTQIANTFQGFVRFKNLAFNPLVDLTSLTTGVINNMMDRVAGDYYHKSSANRANGLNTKLLSSYMAESGKVDKKSQLNHILEFFQVMDIDSRIENTSFGRGTRIAFKSHFAMSKAANLPVTPKVLLSILTDYRLVDGRFMSWTDFYAYKKNENKELTKSEIESQWKKSENDSLYDMLKITKEGITYNDKFEKIFKNVREARTEFENLQVRVIQKSKQVIQNVDGVLSESDQVAAQRDMLTNFFMMHKGWMSIFLTRRFKQRHLNLSTGQYEEGHYITLMNFLGSVIKSHKNAESIKDIFDNLTLDQKRNFKRVGVETGFMFFLLALGSILFKYADDEEPEDQSYLSNLGQLIYLRTVSEYNSTQLLSMHGSLIETLKSPIVAMTSVEGIMKIPGKAYEGLSGDPDSAFWKHLSKQFITKRYHQVGSTENLREQIAAYRHFNDLTLWNLASSSKEK